MEKEPDPFAEPPKPPWIAMLAFASAVPVMTSAVVFPLSTYEAEGAPGATVSFAKPDAAADETLPAASVDVALIVTVPSPRPATLMLLNVTVPAPAVALAVRVTDNAPFASVSVTRSVASDPAGRLTLTESEPALAELTYAFPAPPPLASEIPEG